jgi:uncharacterized membrane protein
MFSNTVWTFWDIFFLVFIFLPLLLVWGFAIGDVFVRRDLSGWEKALWLVAIVILPLIGTLIYLITRPHDSNVVAQAGYYGQPARR